MNSNPALSGPSSGGPPLLLVIDGFGRGGAQRVAVQLIEAWHRNGRRLHLVTFEGPEKDAFAVPADIPRDVIGGVGASANIFVGMLANLRRMMWLRRAFAASGSPVIISFIAVTNILTVLACTGLGVRVVVCERSDPQRQSLSRAWRLLRYFAYRRAEVVTANSQGALSALRAFVPGDRLTFVPNPLAPSRSVELAPLDAPAVVAVGRLHHVKAPDILLRAFAKLNARHPLWRLVFIGEGPDEKTLRSLASELGIAGSVKWIGDIDDPYPWLRAARIFTLPSRHEGMPNALLEAMSCAMPCIVSDASPGPLELVENDVTGLVVPVEDVSSLAIALERLVEDPALARKLGEAAQRRVAVFAPEMALKVWDEVIQRAGLPS